MSLSQLALCGVIIASSLYIILALFGLIIAGPLGIIGLIVLVFVGALFLGVLISRLKNKEDDYYEKNIKD